MHFRSYRRKNSACFIVCFLEDQKFCKMIALNLHVNVLQ